MKGAGSYGIIVLSAGLLLLCQPGESQDGREYIRKGNKLYKKGEFAGSEGMYRRAMTQDKPAKDAGFNLGDALYKQGRFGEAANEFNKLSSGSEIDSARQAEHLYNLGNSLVKEQKFEESIKAYINSLKLNPDNIEAKYNLAYAQDQLKKQQQQQKKQQDQKQKQDQKQDQQKEQEQNKNNQDQKNDQQQQQPQQGQDQQQTISRDDAKRLLDALAANEKETQQKVQRDKAVRARVRVIKNW